MQYGQRHGRVQELMMKPRLMHLLYAPFAGGFMVTTREEITTGFKPYDKPIRYCFLGLSRLMPCDCGWGSMDKEGIKSCIDEPMEGNCRNIIKGETRIPALKIRYERYIDAN